MLFRSIAIVFSALAQVVGTSLLKRVIDEYIEPLFRSYDSKLMTGFVEILCLMAGIYFLGAFCSFLYSRLMMYISTKALYNLRVDLFRKVESLPIRYFDTHTHGDLRSRYTNDTDALREMLSNSVVNMISSSETIVGVFIMMVI